MFRDNFGTFERAENSLIVRVGAQDFDEALMQEMRRSWAIASVRPYDVYMKTLYALVRDRLEDEDDRDILWDDEITKRLADFQKVGVRQAVQMIRDHGGRCCVSVLVFGWADLVPP